jgi:rhamnopyranosyl-N-acetylglucosaminyl-diphospho-decaprenol beta-1,3/1,4-galactofuranosyltransferase
MELTQTHTVIAVVVSHNRLEQLKLIITALQAQSIPLKKIIVVDNDSADGSPEWLMTQSDIIMIRQKNTGGAGGFKTGIQEAMNLSSDWIWLLDDDVKPESNCLDELLRYAGKSQCIQPVRLGQDDRMLDEERTLDTNRAEIISLYNYSFRNGNDYFETNLCCFEGLLIHREIVEKIGLPDERFFLVHDDLVYGHLASKHTHIITTKKAILRKLPSSFTRYDSTNYLYYSMRNLWLVDEYLSKDTPELRPYRRRSIQWQFLKKATEIIRKDYYESKWKAFKMLAKAYADYIKNKSGKLNA